MRYRLRTLLIVLAVGPPLLAGAWLLGQTAVNEYRERETWRSVGPTDDLDLRFDQRLFDGNMPYGHSGFDTD